MSLVFSPQQYHNLVKLGLLPKLTEAEKTAAQKHNKELAQRLSQADSQTEPVENAPKPTEETQ